MTTYRVTADLFGEKIVEQVEAQDEDAAWYIADQRHKWQLNNGLVEELPIRSELLARIQELETAGRPFADLAKYYNGLDNELVISIGTLDAKSIYFTVGQLRKLAALLNNTEKE